MRASCLCCLVVGLLELPLQADLQVSTDFEGGNAEVVRLDQASSTIRIMPALREGRGWPCWWFLRLDGAEPGQTVTLEVQAQTAPYANGKRLAAVWCQPKHASISTDSITWTHTEQATVTEEKVAVYRIPVEKSPLWIAWGPPFLPTHAETLLLDIEARVPGAKKFELAKTRAGRPVSGLRIGDTEASRQVWVNARQHAWEAGGSWVGRGFIEWVASDEDAAKNLRATTCLHFIPIMDVDNVTIGAGGKDSIPRDHNRDWAAEPVYPEVAAAQRMIADIERRQGLDVFIDLHNPGADDPVFFFGPFDFDGLPGISQRHYTRWIELAAKHMTQPVPVQSKYRFATYVTSQEERSRMSSGWVRENVSERAISVTLETVWNSRLMTQDGYQRVGRQLGESLAAWLREHPDQPAVQP